LPDGIRSCACARIFLALGYRASVRGSPDDGAGRNHGLDLSRPASQNGAGQVSRFRKGVSPWQVRESRPDRGAAIEVFLSLPCNILGVAQFNPTTSVNL